jgi:hypothetical protein
MRAWSTRVCGSPTSPAPLKRGGRPGQAVHRDVLHPQCNRCGWGVLVGCGFWARAALFRGYSGGVRGLTVVKCVVVVVVGVFVLVSGGVSAKERVHYGRWPCLAEVTYQTNKYPRMVKRFASQINEHVDSFSLVRNRSGGKADISVRFLPREVVSRKADGALGVTDYGFDLDTGEYFVAMSVLVTDAGKTAGTRKVLRHEMLHAVGLTHIKTGSRVSLMNPVVTVTRPTKADWRAVRALDGKCRAEQER